MKPNSNREWRSLEDIAVVCGGGSKKLSSADFVESGVPAFGAGGQNGLVETAEFDQVGIVLSANGARCGKCFLTPASWTSMANTQVILPDTGSVDAGFLWYQLNDENRWPKSGTAQPFIKPSDVKQHRVWLPPLDEQRRIADVLDRADALRAKRRETLARLDELETGVFAARLAHVPAARRIPLGSALELLRNGLTVKQDRDAGGIPVSRIETISSGDIDPEKCGYAGLQPSDDLSRWLLSPGDILFSHINSPAHVGRTAAYRGEPDVLVHGMNLLLLRADINRVHPDWLLACLRAPAFRMSLRRFVNQAVNQASISMTNLRTMLIPVPSLDVQATFAEEVGRIRKARATYQTHLRLLDTLFASLQQRAFRGDLFTGDLPDELADAA